MKNKVSVFMLIKQKLSWFVGTQTMAQMKNKLMCNYKRKFSAMMAIMMALSWFVGTQTIAQETQTIAQGKQPKAQGTQTMAQPMTQKMVTQTTAAQTFARPKLTVGIIIDQMRVDYIYRYWNKYGNGGFKKLINQGYFCANTQYNYVPTYTGPGHASVYTGTTPMHHGIIGNNWYIRTTGDTVYCVGDATSKTIGAANFSGNMSPRRLITTTITDELRFAQNYKSKTIGISLKDRGAILPAGHSATAAYWFDGATGNWITSDYYMTALPTWMNNFNNKKLPQQYLSKGWNTMLPISEYTESTADSTKYEGKFSAVNGGVTLSEKSPTFPHDFMKLNPVGFEFVKRSPWGNVITTDVAIAAIEGDTLGAITSDFLCISYSSPDYVGHQFGTNAIETEDIYLQLDKDLERLISYLEKRYGRNNFLLFLTADHAAIPNPQYLLDNKIPAGRFSSTTIADTLRKYLQTNYNDSLLLQCYDDNNIYLNYTLLNSYKIDYAKITNDISFMISQLATVHHCLTREQIISNDYSEGIDAKIRNGFHPKRNGDIVVIPEPGLIEWSSSTGTTHGSGYTYDTHVPLLWYGFNIKHGIDYNPYNITDIAATLSMMLHCSIPNACTGKVMVNLMK